MGNLKMRTAYVVHYRCCCRTPDTGAKVQYAEGPVLDGLPYSPATL